MNTVTRFLAAHATRVVCRVAPAAGRRAVAWLKPYWGNKQVMAWYDHVVYEVALGENFGDTLYFFGCYEPEETRWFMALLERQPAGAVIDVGAHMGWYSLLAARRARQVISFEPSPQPRAILQRNISRNGCGNIVVEAAALTDRVGRVPFFENLRADNSGIGRLLAFGDPSAQPTCDVACETLDHYLTTHQIGRVSVVKIDVEGAEMAVIRGGAQTLARPEAPDLLIEVHPGELRTVGSSAVELKQSLDRLGYRLWCLRGRRLEPEAIAEDYADTVHVRLLCSKTKR